VHQVEFSLHESKYYSDRDRARKRVTQKSVFDSWQNKNLLIFFKTSLSEMGPTKTPIQNLSVANSSDMVCEASCSTPTGARITNAWVCKPTPLYVSVAWCLTLILLMWRIGWVNSIPIYIQQDATLHSLFISGNYSTRFGW
jgi:hypothetical protein